MSKDIKESMNTMMKEGNWKKDPKGPCKVRKQYPIRKIQHDGISSRLGSANK